MKNASEWDLNHILQLPAGEFDWLEFKGRKSLDLSLSGVDENKVLDELSKQLSAFANSGGGVLAYGILNPEINRLASVDDGGISVAIRKPNTREWLEDIIPNLVEFPLKKFNVYALTNKFGAPGLPDDRCIVLIDVPDSEDAPHQARDQKYYARVGGKSRPVGHRIVTEMFHRGRYARFEVLFAFRSETWIPQPLLLVPPMVRQSKPKRSVELIVGASNRGKVYAKYMTLRVQMPESLAPIDRQNDESLLEIEGIKYYVQEMDNMRRDVLSSDAFLGINRYGPSWFDPILPGLERIWTLNCSSLLRPEDLDDQKIRWKIHCDNAPPSFGEIRLKDIPFDVRDEHTLETLDHPDQH